MDKIQIKLLPKQLHFLVLALENQISNFEQSISSGNCTDDEISDMQNDLILMIPTLDELKTLLKNC